MIYASKDERNRDKKFHTSKICKNKEIEQTNFVQTIQIFTLWQNGHCVIVTSGSRDLKNWYLSGLGHFST